jgi:hypothetical protein
MWGQSELDHFNVKIEWNINVREVIPENFLTLRDLSFIEIAGFFLLAY